MHFGQFMSVCLGYSLCLYAWVIDGSSLDEPKTFALLNSREMSGVVADRMKYLTKRGQSLCMSAQMCVCVCVCV